ncbi:hypothetical protein AOLI_G00105550 [Acnodon oligacanthus]
MAAASFSAAYQTAHYGNRGHSLKISTSDFSSAPDFNTVSSSTRLLDNTAPKPGAQQKCMWEEGVEEVKGRRRPAGPLRCANGEETECRNRLLYASFGKTCSKPDSAGQNREGGSWQVSQRQAA